MKLVVQRVRSASVSVAGEVVSRIQRGVVAMVAVSSECNNDKVEWMVGKLLNTKLFEDESGRFSKSVVEEQADILVVSQFILYASPKGSKLDFHRAMNPEQAKVIYEQFVARLKSSYVVSKVQEGVFRASMVVTIENEGPVTIILEK